LLILLCEEVKVLAQKHVSRRVRDLRQK